MEKRFGGQVARGGIFINLKTGEFVMVPEEGGRLPGEATTKYLKVPALLAAVAGPLAGLAYVVAMPVTGLVTLAWFTGRLAGRGLRPVTVEWQPGTTHFARRH